MAISNDTLKKAIDIVQWLMILFLVGLCVFIFVKNRHVKTQEANMDDTYIKIYQTQTIEALKKENRELYDSIHNMKDVSSVVKVKYKYRYKTDTLKVKEFVQDKDSIYHYTFANDTIDTQIDIKAKSLQWCKIQSTLSTNFNVITQEKDDGTVITTIQHPTTVDVTTVDTWKKKEKWTKRISYGPSIGVGYGMFSRTPDVYVGFTIGYNLQK